MSSLKDGTPKASWFWGIVLSFSLHAIIFSLAIFWGFGSPNQSEEAQSIEGILVSPSELEQSLKEDKGSGNQEKVKAPRPEEPKKTEVKEEPPKIEEKPKRVEIPKKEEVKKAQKKEKPTPEVEEKPREKDTVALETKKKKQVAEIPKPTEKPKRPSFEDIRNRVIEDMRKVQKEEDKEKERQSVINELKQRKAEANSSDEERGTRKDSGNLNRQSPGARAALASLFINRVREEIKSNWRIPENVPIDGSLNTDVAFRIDEKGKVYDVKVDKPSGNPAFDDFCVKAIYRASPLTPPPSELLEEAKTEGIYVTFNNK